MTRISQDTMISRAQGFSTAAVNTELMMLNVEQGAYYSLDPIAAEIWGLIEAPLPVRAIVAALQPRYAVSAQQCEADVLSFLGQLHQNGMIVLGSSQH